MPVGLNTDMENLLYLLSELEKDSSIPAIEGRLSFNTPAAKCNMARTCGTSWGYCP